MKNRSDMKFLPLLFLLLGLVGFGLRFWLYRSAIDEWGLIAAWQLPEIALWILAAAAAVCAVMLPRRAQVNPANGLFSALSSALLGAALVYQLLQQEPFGVLLLFRLHEALGFAAAAALAGLAFQKLAKKPPFFGFYAVFCIFLCTHMVMCYQLWSEQPQLQNYVFALFAVLAMTLFVYHQTAFACHMRGSRGCAAAGLFALFAFCTAAAQADTPVLYAACALWLFAEQTAVYPAEV